MKPELRAAENWEGPSVNRWNRSHKADVAVSFSGGERNHLFLSQGGSRFQDVSGISGLDNIADGRGFALFDFDRDGWQDIALVNTNAPSLTLYRNELGSPDQAAPVVAVRFVGGNRAAEPSASFGNRDGYGATLRVELADGTTLLREHRCGEGFATQNSATLLVGIGDRELAEVVSVRWPSGATQRVEDVAAGTLLTFYEDSASAPERIEVARSAYPRARASGPAPRSVAAGHLKLWQSSEQGRDSNGTPRLRLYTTTATWCPACKRSLPQVAALRGAFAERELALYGVPVDPDDGLEKLLRYVEKFRPAYRLLRDLAPEEVAAVNRMVLAKFASDVLPSSIVTDGGGRILETVAGVPSISDVRRWLERDSL